MTVTFSLENQIGLLTLNRPDALNALNSQMLTDLEKTLTELKSQFPATLRALVITGAGEKAFVAGADIKEISQLNATQGLEFAQRGQKIFRMIEQLPFPVIAAVNGFCLGGGLELALSCDFIYAADTAKLGLPETNLGLIPGFGGTVRLAKVVGVNRARELIFTAQVILAVEAEKMGLVNRVVGKDELLKTAIATLTTILAKGPLAIRAAKRAVLEAHDLAVDPALAMEAKAFAELLAFKDTQEGTAAFLEKRKPAFKAH